MVKLNQEQKAAVEFGNGPLLIIAGAGTGKTTVITERIKYLIASQMAKPAEILALTFTEKAAREMETRVDEDLPYGYTQMWISTFHSFCDRILHREALHIGLDPKYKLMTQAESVQLLRDQIHLLSLDYFAPLGNPTKFVSGMLDHFSRLQDEDISPASYSAWVNQQKKTGLSEEEKLELSKWQELVRAYSKYEELKVRHSLLDFGDLIVKTLKLFRERPNILAEYQKQFKYVLVDEYQDTNIAQNELVKLLAGKSGNITVVADDDQSIYRFRGAAVSNILQFRKTFPKANLVILSKNYRSGQKILDQAYGLIQHNNPDRLEFVEKIDKKLKSQRKNLQGEIEFLHADRVENEAELVIEKIKKLSRIYQYSDFAILVRANNHAEPFTRALSRAGLPYQFLGPGRLFKQPEVLDLVAYLKVLNNYEDSVSFYRIISLDELEISGREIATLSVFAKKKNLSLFEAAEKVEEINVSKNTKAVVKKIVGVIQKHMNQMKKETAGQLLYFFLEEMELLPKLLNPEDERAQKKAANIAKFFDKLKSYEVGHEDASVGAVVSWLDLAAELGESPQAADSDWTSVNAVNLLTVHSAKGLEFPIVFLVNLVSQRFPTMERREQVPIPENLVKEILPQGDYHLEEERRLFYVGMTRARDRLFLTAANYYGEGKRDKKFSPFVFEALGSIAVGKESQKQKTEASSLTSFSKTPEGEGKKRIFQIDYLSVSQIESFRICPLHYKLKYLVGVPTPKSASQSFGVAIHAAMKDFYEAVKSGQKPNEKLILATLEKNWSSEGFTGKVEEKKFLEKGKVYLTGYLKEGFEKDRLPALLEQKFMLPLPVSGDQRPLKIGGIIDRVDTLSDGGLEIIDYKTGANIPKQKEVDRDLQLSFYSLAASTLKEKPLGVIPEKIKLSLYFFDTQEKISTVRTKEELQKAVAEIFAVREEMEKSDFTCSKHILCGNCEYKLFCGSDI